MIMKITAIATMAIHAPRVNLVARTMMSTEPVMTRPTELITRERIM